MYWALVGFGALFPLGGGALLYAAYDWQQRVKRSFSWPTAQGRVLKSEVALTWGGGVNGASRIHYVPTSSTNIPSTTYSTPTTTSNWEVTLLPRRVPRKNVLQPTPLGAR